jgi:hypothetical protein
MPYLTTNYQIAAGNDNAGGLALVTTLSDGNGVYFKEPQGLDKQSRGLRVYRANGTVARQGHNWVYWTSPVLLAQYEYLKDNYEGLVTIKTAFHSETFANYNAVLTLPDFGELDQVSFRGSSDDPTFTGLGYWLIWWFTKVEAL